MKNEKNVGKGNEPVTLRLTEEMMKFVDEGRRNASDLPSRPELVRRLIQKWIDDGCPDL
ncbi:ribbon-helix-helix protein, CopG family [Roseinatronobacter sp. NSM]|uniref:ribbon-helix-helix protein, CopG family n=1 Tax=Roseinatronobacter sp. NSM TaxID=3457785 RepID=UPI0040361FBE